MNQRARVKSACVALRFKRFAFCFLPAFMPFARAAVLIALLSVLRSGVVVADVSLPRSLFSIAGEPRPGFSNLSDLGIALTMGNTESSSYRLRQQWSYRWRVETLAMQLRYFYASAQGVTGARNWGGALRYERRLARRLGGFVGESVEGDRFAGFAQRYATDLGVRRTLWWDETTRGAVEAGYRYQFENREYEPRRYSQIVRLYGETSYRWNPHVGSLVSVELLPNLRQSENWFANLDFATQSELTNFMALKVGYTVRYSNRPATPGLKKTDSAFTTALVADF